MGIFLKFLIFISIITIIGFIVYQQTLPKPPWGNGNPLGDDPGNSLPEVLSKETHYQKVQPTSLKTVDFREASSSAYKALKASLIEAKGFNEFNITITDMEKFAESCAREIVNNPSFDPFPGYFYDYFGVNFKDVTYYDQVKDPPHLQVESRFNLENDPQGQGDYYQFPIKIEDNTCHLESSEPLNPSRPIPLEAKEYAVQLIGQNDLVWKRLQEDYSPKVQGWISEYFIKNFKYPMGSIPDTEDKFLSAGAKSIITINFIKKIDNSCFTYQFPGFIDIFSGLTYAGPISKSDHFCPQF